MSSRFWKHRLLIWRVSFGACQAEPVEAAVGSWPLAGARVGQTILLIGGLYWIMSGTASPAVAVSVKGQF